MAGHPDWQTTPRNFFATVIDTQSVNLPANSSQTFFYSASQLLDVVALSFETNPLTGARITVFDVGGFAVQREWVYQQAQSGGEWVPLQVKGGTVSVEIFNSNGAAAETIGFKLLGYVGATVEDLLLPDESQVLHHFNLGAGATSQPLIPISRWNFDRMALIATSALAFELRVLWDQPLDGFWSTVLSFNELIAAGAAGAVVTAEVPMRMAGCRVVVVNTGAAAATPRWSARCFRIR